MKMNRRSLFSAVISTLMFGLCGARVKSRVGVSIAPLQAPYFHFPLSTKAVFLTPTEQREGSPHSMEGVKSSVTAIWAPLIIEVGRLRPMQVIQAVHVEVMKDGSRRVWLKDGGFSIYS